MNFFIKLFLIGILFYCGEANAQSTAAILPPAKTTFFDSNGNPLSSGKVYFYIPNTLTFKNTWQDADQSVLNTNPVTLDAAGRALIYGDGVYRQIVKDRNNNTIWDQLTTSPGSGGSTPTLIGDGNLVGTIKPWAGITAPAQYVFAYGQEISRTTYSAFYTAVTLTQTVNCTLASAILTGLADTTQLSVGTAVEAACLAPGSTILSKTTTTVTVSNNANITTTIQATFFPWGNGDGSTTFNVPDLRGRTLAGRDNMGGTAASRLTSTYFAAPGQGAIGGSQSKTILTANLPAYTPSGSIAITDPGHNHSLTQFATGAAGGGTTYLQSGAGTGGTSTSVTSISAAFTGVAQGGTSTAFSIVQPTITLNYIVKITPDTSASVADGVASIGGMTGVILCGTNLICTGNVISVDSSSTILDNICDTQGSMISRSTAWVCGRDKINVQAYGAVGNGVTDDSQAFLDAMTFAKSVRGVVYAPSGVYAVDPAILRLNYDYAWLLGDGEKNSVIVPTSTSTDVIKIGAIPVVKTGNTTISSTSITNLSDVNNIYVGQTVTGLGVPYVNFSASADCINLSPTLTNIVDTTDILVGSSVSASCLPSTGTVLSKTATTVTLNIAATSTVTITATFSLSTTIVSIDSTTSITISNAALSTNSSTRLDFNFSIIENVGIQKLLIHHTPVRATAGCAILSEKVVRTFFEHLKGEGLFKGICLGLPTVSLSSTTVINTTTITGLSSTNDLFVGMGVFGSGIANGTVISAILSSNSIRLSMVATASATISLRYEYFQGSNINTITEVNLSTSDNCIDAGSPAGTRLSSIACSGYLRADPSQSSLAVGMKINSGVDGFYVDSNSSIQTYATSLGIFNSRFSVADIHLDGPSFVSFTVAGLRIEPSGTGEVNGIHMANMFMYGGTANGDAVTINNSGTGTIKGLHLDFDAKSVAQSLIYVNADIDNFRFSVRGINNGIKSASTYPGITFRGTACTNGILVGNITAGVHSYGLEAIQNCTNLSEGVNQWQGDLGATNTLGTWSTTRRIERVDNVVANGKTGATTLTSNGLLIGGGTSAISAIAAGTNGQLPIGQTGGAPVMTTITGATLTAGGLLTVTSINGVSYPASYTSGGIPYASSSSSIASSGTLTANGVVYGGGLATTPGSTAAGTNGQVFLGVSAGAPNWGTMSQDCTITNAGVITCLRTNNSLFTSVATSAYAVKAGMETATSTTTVVNPGVVQYHPGVAKAFVIFDGTGSTASITPTQAYNIASVTHAGCPGACVTGDYTVTFTTAFSATGNYQCWGATDTLDVTPYSTKINASSTNIRTRNPASGAANAIVTIECAGVQ